MVYMLPVIILFSSRPMAKKTGSFTMPTLHLGKAVGASARPERSALAGIQMAAPISGFLWQRVHRSLYLLQANSLFDARYFPDQLCFFFFVGAPIGLKNLMEPQYRFSTIGHWGIPGIFGIGLSIYKPPVYGHYIFFF